MVKQTRLNDQKVMINMSSTRGSCELIRGMMDCGAFKPKNNEELFKKIDEIGDYLKTRIINDVEYEEQPTVNKYKSGEEPTEKQIKALYAITRNNPSLLEDMDFEDWLDGMDKQKASDFIDKYGKK